MPEFALSCRKLLLWNAEEFAYVNDSLDKFLSELTTDSKGQTFSTLMIRNSFALQSYNIVI